MTDGHTIPEADSFQVKAWRAALSTAADNLGPLMNVYKPYVDGLENLPTDGRFLLVGNHTAQGFAEVLLSSYFVRRAIGSQVRPLADRRLGQMGGPQGDLMKAYGAVVGSPESARALMGAGATILVFPGGGREIPKFKGEEYTLRWQNRSGFARIAVEHDYPIVTAALVGADDIYTSITTRDSAWGRFSGWLVERLDGQRDMAMPLLRGIGPTLIPRPQRMYLRFGPPVGTATPAGVTPAAWSETIKNQVQTQLETALTDLQDLRVQDPYRHLNPFAWRAASTSQD